MRRSWLSWTCDLADRKLEELVSWMLAGNEDCPSWMKVPVDTTGRRGPEFACPVPVHTGATTFRPDVVLSLRKKIGEGNLLLY
ncbi:unnamed protein product, partial [Staurois parvus]